jgi:dTDP-4-dehydrorhamnose 3,5-epimerase-like enzyme
MMGVTRISETLVYFYQTTQRYNPEDSHLQQETKWNEKETRTAADEESSI